MPLHGKLRFSIKALVTVVSLAGIAASYGLIKQPHEDVAAGGQIVVVDDTPTASIIGNPKERRAIEAMAVGKAMPNLDEDIEQKVVEPTQIEKRQLIKKSSVKTPGKFITKAKSTSAPLRESGVKHTLVKNITAIDIKKAMKKEDPIAGLLERQ